MDCCTQCPWPCSWPSPTHASARDSWHSKASLGQSLVESLLLSPGSWWAQGFVCALQESVSPVLCKFWGLYGGLMVTSSKRAFAIPQVCCTQSPCPWSSPLLTHTSSGDTQMQFWLTLYGVSGFWCAQGMFEPSEHLWRVWGLILNMISPLLPSWWGVSFAFGCGVSPQSLCGTVQPLLQHLPSCWGFSALRHGVSPYSRSSAAQLDNCFACITTEFPKSNHRLDYSCFFFFF